MTKDGKTEPDTDDIKTSFIPTPYASKVLKLLESEVEIKFQEDTLLHMPDLIRIIRITECNDCPHMKRLGSKFAGITTPYCKKLEVCLGDVYSIDKRCQLEKIYDDF